MPTMWLWVPASTKRKKAEPSGSHPSGERPDNERVRAIGAGSTPLDPGKVFEVLRATSAKEARLCLALAAGHDVKTLPPDDSRELVAWGERRAAHARVRFVGEWAHRQITTEGGETTTGLVLVDGKGV